MQLYGILLQYTVDLAFDWAWLRPVRRPMQEWLWRVPVPVATASAAGQGQAPAGGPRADLREARPDPLESGAGAAARVGGRAGEAPERGSAVRLRRRSRDRRAVAGRAAGDAVRGVQPDAARGGVARTGARGDDAGRPSRRREGAAPEHPRAAAVRHQDPDARRRGARAPSRLGRRRRPRGSRARVREHAAARAGLHDRGVQHAPARARAREDRRRPRSGRRAGALLGPRAHARVHRRRQVDGHTPTSTPQGSTGKSLRGTSFAARCRWS